MPPRVHQCCSSSEDSNRLNYLLLADALVVVHFAFILFVLFGAFTAYRWPKMA